MSQPAKTARAAGVGHNQPPSASEILKDTHKELFDKARKLLAKLKKAETDFAKAGGPKTEADIAKLQDLFGEARDLANDAERIRVKEKQPHLDAGNEIDALFNGEFRDALGTDPKKGGLARRLLQLAADRQLELTRLEQKRQEEAAAAAQREADRLAEQQKRQEEKGQVKQADITAAKVEGLDRQADTLATMAAAPIAEASRAVTASGRTTSVNAVLTCTGVMRAELDLESLRAYFDQDALVKAVNNALKMKAFTSLKGAAIVEKAVGRVR